MSVIIFHIQFINWVYFKLCLSESYLNVCNVCGKLNSINACMSVSYRDCRIFNKCIVKVCMCDWQTLQFAFCKLSIMMFDKNDTTETRFNGFECWFFVFILVTTITVKAEQMSYKTKEIWEFLDCFCAQ